MTSTLAKAVICLAVAQAAASARADFIHMFGDLLRFLYTISIPGTGSEAFVAPSAADRTEFGNAIAAAPGVSARPLAAARATAPANWSDDVPLIEAPAVNRERLLAEDRDQAAGPARIGVVQPIEVASDTVGQWAQMADGGWLWRLRLRAPGAHWVRLLFEPWDPPAGAKLLIFNPARPEWAHGPFGRGDSSGGRRFWTPLIFSEKVALEYHLPPGSDPTAVGSQLRISRIVNGYTGFGASTDGSLRPGPLSCEEDVNCVSGVDTLQRGIAMYTECDGSVCHQCSGGLVTKIPADWTMLFMTSSMCAPSSSNGSGVTFWFFETDECNGSAPDPETLPQVPMVQELARSSNVSLLGLRQIVPAGVGFLAWDSSAWTVTGSGRVIHHSNFSFKRFARGNRDALDIGSTYSLILDTCTPGLNGKLNLNSDGNDVGILEFGSQGAPVFDSNGFIRGVIACIDTPNCSAAQSAGFGKVADAELALWPYLVPVDPIYVDPDYEGDPMGTEEQPLYSLTNATFAVRTGGTLRLTPTQYSGEFLFERAMTVRTTGGSAVIGE